MEPVVRTQGHHSLQLLVTIASHSTYIRLQYTVGQLKCHMSTVLNVLQQTVG